MEAVTDAPWMAGDSPVPLRRTGLFRQCITTADNRFDCTDTGVYYICPADSYILYCDHDSDTFVPLCNRPDCGHADYEGKYYWTCNAWFSEAMSICFFEGYLYVLMDDEVDGFCIMRVNPDGTNRVTVLQLDESFWETSSLLSPTLWNGVLTYCLQSLDDDGNMILNTYYYRLDGSMKEPQLADFEYPRGNDGDAFITSGIGLWDVTTNKETHLADFMGIGYYGAEAAYLILDGVISKVDHATGKPEPLLDTGLTGTYDLHCFPDCIVVKETLPFGALSDGKELETQHLYFYNWAFELLGSIAVKNESEWLGAAICGETTTRIYLALEYAGLPSHYIEKSDFGSGNITLHEVKLPTLPLLETGSSPPRVFP